MRKHLRLLALLVSLSLILSGCGILNGQESEAPETISLPEPSEEPINMIMGERMPAANREVTLYYAMADGTGFSAVTRNLYIESGESLVDVAVNAILQPLPTGERMYFSTGDTRLLSSEVACGIATVSLSIDARNVQNEQEMLALVTSIGNTLLEIEGISGVNVLIGDESEGFCRLPFGLQTKNVTSVTAAYAQLQAERDYFLAEGARPLVRHGALYFPTEDGNWLVPEMHEITFENDNYAVALLEALKTPPANRTCATTAIPDGVELLDSIPEIHTNEAGEHVLELNFSSTMANYLAFSGLEVWELAGSVTLTMCSFIPELDAVRIMVNNDPITICELGDSVITFPEGLMRRSNFSTRIGSIATLYLARNTEFNPDFDSDNENIGHKNNTLLPVECAVSMKSAVSPRSLLTELFAYSGRPDVEVSFPLPEPVFSEDLLGILVEDGIAKINLSANFYRICQSLSEDCERNLVYSMINTLGQLEGIHAVRFYVEGIAAETLAGNIYLRSPLMPNPGIVAEENPEPDVTAAP